MSSTQAAMRNVVSYLPTTCLTNDQLASEFESWNASKIAEKTGIYNRHICDPSEFVSDIAYKAAEKLIGLGVCTAEQVDFLLLCTQCPDYILPPTGCLVHARLGLRPDCGTLDFNHGCSGFVYGLSMAKGLIQGGMAKHVLLLTAETYSKLLAPNDQSVRTIFGDAAAATLVSATRTNREMIGAFAFGTDGRGANELIVKRGGFRFPHRAHSQTAFSTDEHDSEGHFLRMNGPEVFNFTIRTVPNLVNDVLKRNKLTFEEVDFFIFHQANKFMLEHLRRKLQIPPERFLLCLENCGNTVSSTIPIVIEHFAGILKPGMRILLVGFGVGLSWAATLVEIPSEDTFEC